MKSNILLYGHTVFERRSKAMCTAISFLTKQHYFGRNLDLEYHYDECVVITPRNYPFDFQPKNSHPALIGMATVSQGYPLYYEATNEHGLSMAALNFPGNAVYRKQEPGKHNIPPFAFIPWVLLQCKTAKEASELIRDCNIIDQPFSDAYPLSPLHWLISDSKESYTTEPLQDGLKIYSNPVGVLTNNPPFPFHLDNLCNYLNVTRDAPTNRFSPLLKLEPYSRGMGGIGLPGDLSSSSRFVRAAFTKLNSVCGSTENESVSQFFHILGSVEQQRGCAAVDRSFEITQYQSCCNTDTGTYYYRTYENSQITAVDLYAEDLSGTELIRFDLQINQSVKWENR